MTDSFLRGRYGEIWEEGIGRVRSGAVEVDPFLGGGMVDRRRAMTLLIRPSVEVQRRVGMALEELRALEPEQYFYDPAELHVTFLSPFSATEEHASKFDRLEEYLVAVSASVARFAPFRIHFSGVTVSPAAVMAQGFTDARALNALRDDLRGELRSRGLTDGLDGRYRLETAHMTFVRFRRALRDGEGFARALEGMRAVDFGELPVEAMELVRNDWFMSRAGTELLRAYRLGEGSHGGSEARSF